jgi:hypothetical protein
MAFRTASKQRWFHTAVTDAYGLVQAFRAFEQLIKRHRRLLCLFRRLQMDSEASWQRFQLERGRKRSRTARKRWEHSPIANRSLYACLDRLYGSREASNGSIAALNCYGRRDSRRNEEFSLCMDWKAWNGLEELLLICLS